jgi:hypothetical protein
MTASLIHPLIRSAVISSCGLYRYHLYRQVGDGGPVVTFIMLNPSRADREVDDPTIRKVMGFCRRWDCGELHVVNLFAFCATRPADLQHAVDPVGPENRDWVRQSVALACDGLVICAWGRHGTFMGQDEIVLGWIADLCRPTCLGMTRDGHPRHPLYVSYSAQRATFRRRTA